MAGIGAFNNDEPWLEGGQPILTEAPLPVPPAPTAEYTLAKMDSHHAWLLDHPETITLGIRPKSKARPRVTKFGTYMPAPYVLWCKRFAEMLDAAGGYELLGGPDNALTIVAEFGLKMSGSRPAKWRDEWDGQLHTSGRADVDNLIGAVMDAVLGKEEGGDGRVGHLNVRKVWAREWYIKIRPIFRAGK